MATTPPPVVITSKPEGLWDRQRSSDHFAALQKELVRQRATHGHARVLVDLSALLVQPQDTVGSMQSDSAAIYRSGDKVALVGAGALLRMQVKRIALPAEMKAFDSMDQAMAWLEQD